MSNQLHPPDNIVSQATVGIRRYRLLLAYDGSAYAGWQRQSRVRTVQEEFEIALAKIVGRPIMVHACSRTDQGVHARNLACHIDLPEDSPPLESLHKGLNAVLPSDIRVCDIRRVPKDFHARYSAKAKEYRYFIWNGPILPPDRRLYWTWIRHPLDVGSMQAAARFLIGRHDFASFTANANRPVHSTTRTIQDFRISRRGHEVVIRVRADGFLYRMVRSLVGFLLRVGEGALAPDSAREILATHKRTARVPTAPPQGLFLWHVYY